MEEGRPISRPYSISNVRWWQLQFGQWWWEQWSIELFDDTAFAEELDGEDGNEKSNETAEF